VSGRRSASEKHKADTSRTVLYEVADSTWLLGDHILQSWAVRLGYSESGIMLQRVWTVYELG
jgi:hypothetical protein